MLLALSCMYPLGVGVLSSARLHEDAPLRVTTASSKACERNKNTSQTTERPRKLWH